MSQEQFPLITQEFAARIKAFNEEWYKKYRDIGAEPTPQVDGNGKKIINKKGSTGYDYIEETYMRDMLDKHFPGWAWEKAGGLQFLGSEWVVADGHLIIVDEHLTAFGIVPPTRRFWGADSVRIQYKSGAPHTPENIVDVGDNVKQAITSALKYAINRMTRIGDDIYGKRLEYEGAGTTEEVFENILENSPSQSVLNELVKKNKGKWSEVFFILNVGGADEIKDWKKAIATVRKAKNW